MGINRRLSFGLQNIVASQDKFCLIQLTQPLYNTACEKFPSVIIARTAGFDKASLYEIENPEEREAPIASFNA